MRVLVIGGSGKVGTVVVERLKSCHEVVVFDLPGYACNHCFTPIGGAVRLAEIWTSTYGFTDTLTESITIPARSTPAAVDSSRR